MSEMTVSDKQEKAQEKIKTKSGKIKEEDIQNVLNKREKLEKKFQGNGYLGKFLANFKIMFSMLQDYWYGNYRDVPWMTIAAIVVALLYVLNPVDLIPDFIPVIGLIDDATIIAACLSLVQKDLNSYISWKETKEDS